MKNGVKFIIAALVIIAGVFMFQSYKSGGFENMKSAPVTQEADVEAH
jgi:predicted negative regulator of RcsB-dependent stress response